MDEREQRNVSRLDVTPVDIEVYLSGVDFPAERDELIAHAEAVGAPAAVIESLEDLPDAEYDSPADVTRELLSLEDDPDTS